MLCLRKFEDYDLVSLFIIWSFGVSCIWALFHQVILEDLCHGCIDLSGKTYMLFGVHSDCCIYYVYFLLHSESRLSLTLLDAKVYD